jgi:hypothetical protein
MKRCSCHCSGCGRCFEGLKAFDRHRVGEHGSRKCSTKGLTKSKGECNLTSVPDEKDVSPYVPTPVFSA